MATDTLQRTGSLSPDQVSSLDGMIKHALNIWAACVITEVGRHPEGISPPVVVDTAMGACSRDKDEVAAWLQLADQAHISKMLAAKLLGQQEARLRANALDYLASGPGEELDPNRGVGGLHRVF
jgi:hypothetical protein